MSLELVLARLLLVVVDLDRFTLCKLLAYGGQVLRSLILGVLALLTAPRIRHDNAMVRRLRPHL